MNEWINKWYLVQKQKQLKTNYAARQKQQHFKKQLLKHLSNIQSNTTATEWSALLAEGGGSKVLQVK